MTTTQARIVYTLTDEAPALATFCLLPIVQRFTRGSGVKLEPRDISLAGRILSQFPEYLKPEQRVPDALQELGAWAKTADANIIKLPNISASLPQLQAAIRELQEQGYAVPNYPVSPETAEEVRIAQAYARVLGSAVNPVLREGNSDRRAAAPVKAYARSHPHSMGAWSPQSKSHVAHMQAGDFYGSEQSCTITDAGNLRIVLRCDDGQELDLRDPLAVEEGDVIDAAVMSCKQLQTFFAEQIADAKESQVLWSLHLKATMMKVSDPIMFGHAVRVFFAPVFERHAETLKKLGVNPNNGVGDLVDKISSLPESEQAAIHADLEACYAQRPPLAMVDSDRGITNLHVPSDIIVDASMPAAIRSSGQMWGPDGKLADMKAVIPDRCYAGVYQAVIDDCIAHGAFDPRSMGSVPNVGLMAQKAEEYGSHDKTFEIKRSGQVLVIDQAGQVLTRHVVEEGDIWRMCQTKDVAIRDWVRLAVERARVSQTPAVFWLDAQRAHDAELIKKVQQLLAEQETEGLDISILAPVEAARHSLQRLRCGEDTISVTGNVLRDYLTDLFPILELGTSAKMLSIVPLLAGGGLYETGAGGSAPKHVQQFVREGHLRWDSLGEYLALSVSLEDMGRRHKNPQVTLLAKTLSVAVGRYLNENKAPSRRAGELDNRGCHFYLALYWSQALADQQEDSQMAASYAPIAQALLADESLILRELAAAAGPCDMGGYYHPDHSKVSALMLPSPRMNEILGLTPGAAFADA